MRYARSRRAALGDGMNDTKKTIIAYKGFDKDLKCRGYQFEIGKTFEQDGDPRICEHGFHACEYPLDVFDYYQPAKSRYARVEMHAPVIGHASDSKVASARINIVAELTVPELVERAFEWILSRCKPCDKKHVDGDRSASSATGEGSASSATGYGSASSATGDGSASSATGDRSASLTTGCGSSSESSSENDSPHFAIATGLSSRARASAGGAIVLSSYDDERRLLHVRASKVGENGIKPDVWYELDQAGQFMEASS